MQVNVTRDERTTRVKQLIERGKKEGRVLYDDLSKLLPANCESGPDLDEILMAIEVAGLDLTEEPKSESKYQPQGRGDPTEASEIVDDPLAVYLREVCKVPQLDRAREIELVETLHQESLPVAEAAKKDLVEANLRLVVSIAKAHTHRGAHVLHLIQEGNTALMRAVDSYDHERGYRFSTYAAWLVRQSIVRAVRRN
jgi:RNA polymerase primary sigma factor